MVGAIFIHGAILKNVEGIMDQYKYIQVVGNPVLPKTRELFRESPWVFNKIWSHVKINEVMGCTKWQEFPKINSIESLRSILRLKDEK